ncbi:MAG: type IV pilus assembly protein PilM [Candidatus Krumholzibacteriia bacterium]
MFGFLKSKQKTLTGMDIGSSVVKCLRLDLDQKPPAITHFAMVDLAPEAIVDGEIMDRELVIQALQECAEKAGLPREPVATAVSGRAVIVKKIVMDKMSEDDAREAIFWEAEQHVPFDIDDITLDFQILNEDIGAGQMEILLVAAKKDMVQTHAELIRDAGFHPMVIEVASFANQNAWEFARRQAVEALVAESAAAAAADGDQADLGDDPDLAPEAAAEAESDADSEFVALLDVGGGVTNVHIVKDGVPYFTRDLPIGTSHFVEEFQKQLGLTYETASAVACGDIGDVDTELVADIVRSVSEEIYQGLEPSLSYLKNSGEADGIDRIVVSGGGARLPGLAEYLAECYQVPGEVADPLAGLAYDAGLFGGLDPERLGPMLTVSVGLALRKAVER